MAVDRPADAVLATLDWRRRDLNPEEKGVIVVDAATGEQVTNVARFTINREKGEIVFQPQTVPGNYYIYYLKNIMTGSRYYPTVHYMKADNTASDEWLKKNRLTGKKASSLPAARLIQYQTINEFHSFYPMEVIATKAEKEAILKAQPEGKYVLFTEDRRYPNVHYVFDNVCLDDGKNLLHASAGDGNGRQLTDTIVWYYDGECDRRSNGDRTK